MLVPRYWAEHRIQLREGRGPQTTIRRWGWSALSQTEAEQHARERAEAVAVEVRSGRRLSRAERREGKAAYCVADGVPIREEILSDHPECGAVVTRNVYGAHCLNVPDVLFADVDLDPHATLRSGDGNAGCLGFLACAFAIVGMVNGWWLIAVALIGVAVGIYFSRRAKHRVQRERLASPAWITSRVEDWCAAHPSWSLHLYRTPAGYRLLATHALFDPAGSEVAEFCTKFPVDPLFVHLCLKQRCFRARLTGKPWRMGIPERMNRRVWPPPTPEALAARQVWAENYERVATGFSACRYVGRFGTGSEHPRAAAIRRLHDEGSRAMSDLPLA